MLRTTGELSTSVKCRAHTSKKGTPCKRWAIKGGVVCPYHGGSAPQVKAKAAARLLALQNDAVSILDRAMKNGAKNKIDMPLAVTAAKDVLDRTGMHAKTSIELSAPDGGPIQQQISVVFVDASTSTEN